MNNAWASRHQLHLRKACRTADESYVPIPQIKKVTVKTTMGMGFKTKAIDFDSSWTEMMQQNKRVNML
jgi:hypothetical protein